VLIDIDIQGANIRATAAAFSNRSPTFSSCRRASTAAPLIKRGQTEEQMAMLMRREMQACALHALSSLARWRTCNFPRSCAGALERRITST
jgi:hypothetical protein